MKKVFLLLLSTILFLPLLAQNPSSSQEEPLAVSANEGRQFYMSIKTNMLCDAIAVPNLGVEFYLGDGWTIGGDWVYAWWKKYSRHRFWQTYGGELNVRKYFGRKAEEKPLSGHHIGIYGQMLSCDIETNDTRGYTSSAPGSKFFERMNWGGGIEYGYSLAVARRLNIDFNLGIGYFGGEFFKYKPINKRYIWQETVHWNWIGPTKAEVSLVWLIGRNNYNNKGGKR